jgi:uncharacterized membrane protein YfcA
MSVVMALPDSTLGTGGALAGGMLGGMVAGKIRPELLRWIVVVIGVATSIIYFVR